MAPKSKKDQLIDEVKRLYIEEQKSLGEIKGILGPSIQTLSRWLGEDGVTLAARPRNPNVGRTAKQQAEINLKISEAQKNRVVSGGNPGGRPRAVPHETRSCANAACAATFQVLETSTQQFCSRTCARVIGNKDRWEGKRKETTCPCGTIFYSPHPKKYCSDECLKTYGKKRQADPENHSTFNCLNCGGAVTRRKGLGHHKYCSNACAQKHTKVKKHYGVEGLEIVFDSSYETLFWSLCAFLKVSVERFDREQSIELPSGHHYGPDFYLPQQALHVEVKGFEDEDDRMRYAAWQENHTLVVLDRAKLQQLRGASRERFVDLLTDWSQAS